MTSAMASLENGLRRGPQTGTMAPLLHSFKAIPSRDHDHAEQAADHRQDVHMHARSNQQRQNARNGERRDQRVDQDDGQCQRDMALVQAYPYEAADPRRDDRGKHKPGDRISVKRE
ncbi:hypothetical protein BGX30_010144 [Mortierella sp. GBA39]|nr:hypothetical protein BGX30_010144 [Mortierella sp. GBA39]